MDESEIEVIASLWNEFFPQEKFFSQDPRIAGIKAFFDFLMTPPADDIISELNVLNLNYSSPQHVYINVQLLNQRVPFSDFEFSLQQRPIEVIGSLGIALSLCVVKRKQMNPFLDTKVIIRPRLYALSRDLAFGDVKSSTVGQLISLTGHVVRVSACRPLVESAAFMCSKCMQMTTSYFEDGIFMPPSICNTPKCYNKYLELDRSTVCSTDYQRVKLSELDEVAAVTARRLKQGLLNGGNTLASSHPGAGVANEVARIPRTIEIEVRGSLINTCIPGDLLSCVGIVKTIQMEAPRPVRGAGGRGGGGYRESGLHELYVMANSLMCLKSSGDRRTSIGRGAFKSTSSSTSTAELSPQPSQIRGEEGGADDITLDASVPQQTLTMLDEINPHVLNVNSNDNSNSNCNRNKNGNGSSPSSDGSQGIADVNAVHIGRHPAGMLDSLFAREEVTWMKQLGVSQQAFPLLVHSLCPAIFGHDLVKAGLLLALFGGSPYKPQTSTPTADSGAIIDSSFSHYQRKNEFQVRSDIHVLVVGDPGLGKSQMLRAAANIAPRAVFVCGNTSTAAGLTVTVSREQGVGGGKGGGDLCIEAGALILADQGVCCIDELDKISSEQHALLEAMEQQCISVAKSGVVTSLKSRTTVLAAANPVGGHYNKRKTVSENLKMNAALLSRFDLIFILVDRPDAGHDRRISEHIMKSAKTSTAMSTPAYCAGDASQPTGNEALTLAGKLRRGIEAITAEYPLVGKKRTFSEFGVDVDPNQRTLSADHMRRYIEYARACIHPVMTPAAAKVLQHLYLTMRAQSAMGQSIPVTTRHLESLIRLSQARARIDLRTHVTESDAQDVVHLLQESLLDVFTTDTGAIDCSRRGGMSLAKQVKALVKIMTRECVVRDSQIFSRKDIADLCSRLGLEKDVDSLIDVMRTECYLLLKGPRLYQLMTAQ